MSLYIRESATGKTIANASLSYLNLEILRVKNLDSKY